MILFSTLLNINESLTKELFLNLVVEWNNTSKYEENIVKLGNWDGISAGKYGCNNLSLEVVEYPEENILAVRHEKVTEDSVIWDTDYVVNFNEKRISIRLERTYREDALVMHGAFSTPHFITLLIERGYLATDEDLPVLRTPIMVTDQDLDVIMKLKDKNDSYMLPVVYIAKTKMNQDPLNTSWLASRLKGAAHILVEASKESCRECIDILGGTREDFGAVKIYYPTENVPRKRFLYRSLGGNREIRLEKVVKEVIQYWTIQRMDLLYTWQGVTNAILNQNLTNQIQQRQEAEIARKNIEEEMNQVYETFDEDLNSLQQKLDELVKANEALMIENSVLRAKLNTVDAMPIVYQGEEEDFYPNEIKDMILGVLDDALFTTENSTRKADILTDILQCNEYLHLNEEKKQRVKAIFKGYKTLTGAMKQELNDLGMTITDDGKHYKLTYHDDPRYMVTIGKTPSDSRAGSNNAAMINKIML